MNTAYRVCRYLLKRLLPALLYQAFRALFRAMFPISDFEKARSMKRQSDLFREVLRRNLSKNCSELHLLYTFTYLKHASLLVQRTFEGGEVLEIGSCAHPGLALILLLAGAKKVHLNNITDIENRIPLSYAQTVYALMQCFQMEVQAELFDVVQFADGQEEYVEIKPELLNLIPHTDGARISLDTDSLDMIFSITVFEHLRLPGALIRNTFRMLKPGGWCFHSIDLRDHRDFSEPLAFLRLSENEFRAFDSTNSRLRASDYLYEFTAAGFKIDYTGYCIPHELTKEGRTDPYQMLQKPIDGTFKDDLDAIDIWVTDEMRKELHPDFQKYSLAELSATGINIVCHKE